MKNLRWPFIAAIAACGFLYALATITAWIHGFEPWIGLALIVGTGKAAAFFTPAAPLRNAFISSFLMALTAVWTQAAFLPLYFENNPEYRAVEIPLGLSAFEWTFLSAPVGAVFAGVLSTLIAWLAAFFVRALRKS